ncbi:MAG TPA: hypothetical protein VHU18_02445 [Rhizomicrobium sp.]|jgi:hypothetical protein|nr:hypothetical protein [Rhizomicrobium sp.]
MYKMLLLSVALLLPVTAFAAPHNVTLSPNGAMTVFHGTPGKHMISNWNPPSGKKIFNTFGKDNAYNPNNGWTIANPGAVGFTQWFAFPITPSADATVTKIAEAIGYVTGTNSVTIALMSDNGGVPGDVLQKKTVKNLDTFGNCCNVAVDKFKTGVPVKAGTTYWVAALLPSKKQANTWDAWNLSTANTNAVPAAFYNGTSWTQTTANYSAFAVYGQ